MNRERALDILIANVYCIEKRLSCSECPLYEDGRGGSKCKSFNDDDLLEAVKVLNE